MKTRNVAIFIFNDAEVLDFAGPFEVFNVANEVLAQKAFNVYTVSETGDNVRAKNGFEVKPNFSFSNFPRPDIVIIPGGEGRKIQMNEETVLEWVKSLAPLAQHVASVCTGAFILGNAGLLKGLKATTHHASYDEFEIAFRDTKLIKNVKYVDNGKIITAGGISAGINMSLYLVDKLLGKDMGKRTAEYMEYDYS